MLFNHASCNYSAFASAEIVPAEGVINCRENNSPKRAGRLLHKAGSFYIINRVDIFKYFRNRN